MQPTGNVGRHLVLDGDMRPPRLAVLPGELAAQGVARYGLQPLELVRPDRIATPEPSSAGAAKRTVAGAAGRSKPSRRSVCADDRRWNRLTSRSDRL
jgi:hypothetical protein